MTLPTNAHTKCAKVFRNGVRRVEVETLIGLCINTHPNSWICVKDMVALARFMESAATDAQLAHVAYQMSEIGELKRITRGGNYYYCWWADEPPMPTAAY